MPEFLPSEYDDAVFREMRQEAEMYPDRFIDGTKARRSSFAAMGDLASTFENSGITDDDVWTFFKEKFEVSTRKHLTDKQWSTIAATLQSAKRDDYALQGLVEQVKTILPKCYVYRIEPDTTVAVYEGAFTGNIRKRCQTHADLSGYPVHLVWGDEEVEKYQPNDVPF